MTYSLKRYMMDKKYYTKFKNITKIQVFFQNWV